MKLERWITVGVVSAVLIFFAGIGMAQDEKVSMSEWTQIVQSLGDKGKINWSAGYIEAIGMGAPPERYIGKPNARPMALRAAKVDAYRNLLEITKGVQVSSETTVRDFVTESDVIRAQIEGLVKGATVANQEYLSDGTVEVTLRMPLKSLVAESPILEPMRSLALESEEVVGITQSTKENSIYFPELNERPSIGSVSSPDYEAILKLHPDTVWIHASMTSSSYEQFQNKLNETDPTITVLRIDSYKPSNHAD